MSAAALAERQAGALFQVSGWPESFAQSAGGLMRKLGFAGLGNFHAAQSARPGESAGDEEPTGDGKSAGTGKSARDGESAGDGDLVSFRTAPERILVRLPDGEIFRRTAAGLDLSLSPVLELTGSRRIFRVVDAEILPHLAAVDFSEEAFPLGAFAQAECLGTGMLFHRAAGSAYDIYVPRSWSESFRDFAEEVGAG